MSCENKDQHKATKNTRNGNFMGQKNKAGIEENQKIFNSRLYFPGSVTQNGNYLSHLYNSPCICTAALTGTSILIFLI